MKRTYLLGLAFLSVLQSATAAEIYTCNVGARLYIKESLVLEAKS